jgi:DNA-binding transcriptional MocR family regulator
MAEWAPRIESGEGYIHRRIVAALEADIAAGLLAPDARLPTHRRLAEQLGVSLGAVTRAYVEAEAKGLITARVGRGSFVASSINPSRSGGEDGSSIDLSLNLAPSAPAQAHLAEALTRLRRRSDLGDHAGYAPLAGFEAHRRAAATWLATTGRWRDLDWRRIIECGGAQQAIAISLAAVCRPGDAVIAEAATFTGLKALAAHMDYRLVGADLDGEGLSPEALDRAAAESGARVAYIQPLQNPTGRIMSLERRRAIVEVARRRGLMIVEDDLYGAYASELDLPPLATLAPEQVFYVSGLSKSLSPGLRIGYCVPPLAGDWLDRCLGSLRAIAFGPPGFGGLIAVQWIEDGTALEILSAHRSALTARTALALSVLGEAAERPPNAGATHLWLPMSDLDAERAAARALREGVLITPPTAHMLPGARDYGLRVCLGATPDLPALERGLKVLARALSERADRTLGMV